MSRNNRTAANLEESIQSPAFILDLGVVRQSVADYRTAFPAAQIYYAMKANPHDDVVRAIAEEGCGVEAASLQEVVDALRCGVPADLVILGTAVKPRAHVEAAFELGVHRYAADSKPELEMLAKAAPGSKVFIRALVDDSDSVFQMSGSGKFGAALGDIVELVNHSAAVGLVPWGLSFNVGSQSLRAEAWSDAIRAVQPAVEKLAASGLHLEVLNIGGGFPTEYRDAPVPTLTEIATYVETALSELPHRPELILEPGRGLVASAGTLVTTVEARVDRSDGPWLYLDAGVYNALFEAMAYQGRTMYPVRHLGPTASSDTASFTIAGPTGDGIDVIARQVELTESIDVGTRLVFDHTGAYTSTMAAAFNGFPVPPIRVAGLAETAADTSIRPVDADLPTIASRLAIGFSAERTDWNLSPADYSPGTLRIAGHPVMEDWEQSYMTELASIAGAGGGRILELGYGLGLSTRALQALDIQSHVVIECHPDVAQRCIEDQRDALASGRLHLLTGFWQEVTFGLAAESFDGILFDTYPLNEAEIHRNHWSFFPEAFRLLRPGGMLTYYSDEADSLGEDHLAQLVSAGFSPERVSLRVCRVQPPDDCEYWQASTIVAPIVIK